MSIKEICETKQVTLVDVRTPLEFQGGSVVGAINIPMNEVVARIDELRKMEPLVVFCRSGNRSEQVMHYLRKQGVVEVWNGGGWIELNSELYH
tara:strand:- start:536 stop:814 length:279 start_codon:yes stop_codon:yes gene_type:complete